VNAALTTLASRLFRLIGDPKLDDPLDLAVGAVQALTHAEELGYKDRGFPLPAAYYAKVKKLAETLARGELVTDKPWLGGFYFNSALLRIAADYHQVLKLITGRDDYVPRLRERLPPTFKRIKLDKVHEEVNAIKHEPTGVSQGRNVEFAEAIEALEELTDLIEDYSSGNQTLVLARAPGNT
jgi:hypothetical protein